MERRYNQSDNDDDQEQLFQFDEQKPVVNGQPVMRQSQQQIPTSSNTREVPHPTALPFGTTPPTISFLESYARGNSNTTTTTNTTDFTSPNRLVQSPSPRPEQQQQNNYFLQSPNRPPPRPPSVDWTLKLFRLEDFIFGKTVGTGTFGRVRLVRLRAHEKYFAMKIMRKDDIIRLHQVDHIFSEKFLLSRLSCPFIIRMYGTFQDQNHLYMLLEYAIGGELFTYLRRAGRFTAPTTRFYAAQIVLALQYMHALGIVYRDLKPENLLLDSRGNIKIADFGFAKIIPDNRTWTLCGTPEYLAPEIILSRGHGRPVDWWALGVLIYEMAAGYPPYYDETPYQIYEKILAGQLEFPEHFDEALRDLLRGLLNPDPVRRLGCGVGGAGDVQAHAWFRGVDWDALQQRQVPAPFVPPVRHSGDTSNFEEYPEDESMAPVAIHEGPDPATVFIDF